MREIVKKKGKNAIIISSIFMTIVILLLYIVISTDKNISNVLKGACEVHNINDLKYCYNENQYVRIYYDDVYTTEYGYYTDDVLRSYYLDLDIEGYSFIALVRKKTAEKLINNEQDYLEGFITYFSENEEHSKALEAIKNDYLELFSKEYGEEFTKENIENIVIPFQLDAYNDTKSGSLATVCIFLIILIIMAILLISAVLKVINPDKYGDYAKIENKELLEHEFNNSIIYKNKNLYITPNYIIAITIAKVIIKENKKLIWIYKHVQKVNFVPVSTEYVFRFLDGSQMSIAPNEQILSYYPNRLVGYTQQNIQTYNNIVKQYKESIR